MFKRLALLVMVGLMMTLAQAQDMWPMLAVEYQGGLYVMNRVPTSEADLQDALTLIDATPTDNFHAVWSPDGNKLAYTVSPEDQPYSYQKALMLWDGNQSIQLVDSISVNFPIGWTRDGRIFYTTFDASAADMSIILRAATIAPEAGTVPDDSGAGASAMVGCGIGTILPMEARLWDEADEAGLRSILVPTDYGLVFPAECGGMVSLFRSQTGETFAFTGGKMIRAVLSPDGSRLAGIVPLEMSPNGNIVIVDLLTMAETTIPPTEPASVLAWGGDGSLYYASVNIKGSLLDGLTTEQVTLVTTLAQTDASDSSHFFQTNTIRLYRLAPDGTETLLHEQDAFAVGRLQVSANRVVYSTVANGEAWVQGMLAGELVADDVYFGKAVDAITVTVNGIVLKPDGTVESILTLPGDLRHVEAVR